MAPALTPVRVKDCSCPDTPHDGHHVFLAERLGFEGGMRAEQALARVLSSNPGSPPDQEELVRQWLPIFVRYGAMDWDLCDDDGNPLPFDVEALLDDYELARPVADKSAELYEDAILAPFLDRLRKRSPATPTTATTSVPRRRTRSQSGSQ